MYFEPVLRFVVTSDIHYKVGVDTEVKRFESGMQYAYKYANSQLYKNIDALYVVGDFANSGSEEEMLMFKNSLDKVIDNDTKIILTMSSHEFKANGEETALKLFKKIFNQAPDNHIIINDFHFISITTENGCSIKEKKQQWLKKELVDAVQDYQKPVFVFQHPHLSDTVYGSINWGDDDIITILMDYPQVVDFSGHSHAPINDPRSIHQKYFTSCGTGSFSYFELDEFDNIEGTVPSDANNCAQYLIVEVDKQNKVRIIPVDALTENFFNDGHLIEKPWNPDSFEYTDKRYLTAEKPVFSSSDIEVNYLYNIINIKVPQAYSCDERVDSYIIRIRDKDNNRIYCQKSIFSSYYLYNMPSYINAEFNIELAPGIYNVEITAQGFWNNYSDKLTGILYVK